MQERYFESGDMCLTMESINAFMITKAKMSDEYRRRWKRILNGLYQELPENKLLTRENLTAWREKLVEKGYKPMTITNYVKCVNSYLAWAGIDESRFRQGQPRDLAGKRFGNLIALYEKDDRKNGNIIWHCRCDCGKEIDVLSVRLIGGNTQSCGCRKVKNLYSIKKYYENTSIEQALSEKIRSDNSSGCTGVGKKHDKWYAQITYKGIHYFLGYYDRYEDAVKVRKRAKEMVQSDALELLKRFNAEREISPAEAEKQRKGLRKRKETDADRERGGGVPEAREAQGVPEALEAQGAPGGRRTARGNAAEARRKRSEKAAETHEIV